jgi:uncharacterized membrane protein
MPVNSLTLKKNEKGKLLIGVQVPRGAERGTYIFNVQVALESENPDEYPSTDKYDNPLQMIVKVP